ncbi:hypothetical protein [uncultured Sphingomonas sp.]|uniref:hypothetical protein n=1 Tax=uncultured Sphingomonas sp. TaxID=158754 RepID=UPI0025847015|nr:hypothetical protein [uncultured Sphingomonas sp.]
MDDRKAFLMEMYRQMFADINRQMTVVWQAVSVVVGAFALLALVEKNVIPLDIAVSLIVILSAWMYAHMLDGSYWYNRNLVIIANIERQFLLQSDLREIQYYFGMHRTDQLRMITYFRIQATLAIAMVSLVGLFHFFVRVWPGLYHPGGTFEPQRTLPYLAMVGSIFTCVRLARGRRASYRTFLANSPGVAVDTTGIAFGAGHPVNTAPAP